MDADYSVELGPTAPALEIPWRDPEGRLHYVDLRAAPDLARNIERIPEAQQFPALRRFLLELNSPRSAWQTAKCDVWSDEIDSAENLYGAGFCRGCYVDFVLAEPAAGVRGSLEVHQRAAKEMARRLEENDALEATAEIVVRRCYLHRKMADRAAEESEAGYCLTQFLTGYGASELEAAACWERAMEYASGCWLAMRLE